MRKRKKIWIWIYLVFAALAVVGFLYALGLFDKPLTGETVSPSDTTTTTTITTTVPTEDAVTPGTLTFTGKVLELDSDSVLMECYDKEKFDTVWVSVAQTGVSPQVGEEYFVEYEDFMMPSLPPRITAVKMEMQETSLLTGEALYDAVLDAVVSAFSQEGDVAIPDHPEMSDLYDRCESLTDVGWVLADLDRNGQKELLIGDQKTATYPFDGFTIKDGQLVHLFASGERDYVDVLENGYLRNTWSDAATCNGVDYYRLVDGEMQFVERVTYDAAYALKRGMIADLQEADSDNCYFHTAIQTESDPYAGYRAMTADEYKIIQENYGDDQAIEISYHKLG